MISLIQRINEAKDDVSSKYASKLAKDAIGKKYLTMFVQASREDYKNNKIKNAEPNISSLVNDVDDANRLKDPFTKYERQMYLYSAIDSKEFPTSYKYGNKLVLWTGYGIDAEKVTDKTKRTWDDALIKALGSKFDKAEIEEDLEDMVESDIIEKKRKDYIISKLQSVDEGKTNNVPMHFTATVSKDGKDKKTENLDNMGELQEFGDRMAKRGHNKMVVKAYDSDGLRKTNEYDYNGSSWDKK